VKQKGIFSDFFKIFSIILLQCVETELRVYVGYHLAFSTRPTVLGLVNHSGLKLLSSRYSSREERERARPPTVPQHSNHSPYDAFQAAKLMGVDGCIMSVSPRWSRHGHHL